MKDTQRLVLQGRAIIVLLVLILVVNLRQGVGTSLEPEEYAQLGAAGAAVVYALRALIPRKETAE